MKPGILYGVGVGPGDPELLTLKAVRLIRDCDVIAIPQKKAQCFALHIAAGAVPELQEKPILEIEMPMTRDKARREQAWTAGAAMLRGQLDQGKNVAFLTLGDSTIYSTCGYLQRLLQEQGYEVQMIPGVPSFCASAAALGIPLCEDREELHLIPGSTDHISETLKYPGTKVFMKGNLPELLDMLKRDAYAVQGVQNCGTEEEAFYRSVEEIPADAGYYTVVIVKEKNA